MTIDCAPRPVIAVKLLEARATGGVAVVVLEVKVETHLTGQGHLVYPGDEFECLAVLPAVVELVRSLVSQILSIRSAEQPSWNVLAVG